MKIVPVIDILNGLAVHAIRGKRSEYQQLQSSLCKSVDPLEVSMAFEALGFSELYVADLDAITGDKLNFQLFSRIAAETKLKLMVDAGVTTLETTKKLLDSGVSKAIIGTETLSNESFVAEAVRVFGSERVVVSLDLKGDRVLVRAGFNGSLNALDLLGEFKAMGVSSVIVLDLARVGSAEGVNIELLKKALATMPMGVYVGGGVRDIKDLLHLKKLGVSGVLVATALHSGKISIKELKQAGLL